MDSGSPEYRKIQVLGRSSFAVTLPKSWVREMNLDSGSLVVLSLDGKGNLIIVPESHHAQDEKPAEKVLETKTLISPGALEEGIRACYKIGYETIRIRHPGGLSPTATAEIHEAVESLYGTLIVSETANETKIQSSIDIRTFTVKSLITRMGSFFVYLCEQVNHALLEGSLEDARAVEYRAKEADKIHSLLVRQLVQGVRSQQIASRVGLSDVIQCLGSRMVAKALRDMARSILMISGIVEQASKANVEDVRLVAELVLDVAELYKRAYEALLREDIAIAAKVLGEQESLARRIADLEKRIAGEDHEPASSALVSLLRELQNAISSLAVLPEVAVNRYVERE